MAFVSPRPITLLCRQFLLGQCLRAKLPTTLSSATICSKELMDPNVKRPKPWPHQKRKFNLLDWHVDSTVKRFNENTKIIVVDGNIGSGKSAVAKELAEKFGMRYLPEPDMVKTYITPYGYDLREIDHLMPTSFKSIYIDKFYKNPRDPNVAKMQFRMFMLRYINYLDVLKHLLNTGDGFVMDRCVFGDYVFLEAMYQAGYVRKEVQQYYYDIYESCVEDLMKPHLIVYLDIDPDTALERIKKRNREAEVNSEVLTRQYLSDIEYFYKERYLKYFSQHSEMLIYDWSEYGDVEVVVEDIERINFDNYTVYDTKCMDWRIDDDWDWGSIRRTYTNDRQVLLSRASIIRPRVYEVLHPPHEIAEYREIMQKVPGTLYSHGYNPDQGDNVYFKVEQPLYHIGETFWANVRT